MSLGLYFLTGTLLSGLIFVFPKKVSSVVITLIFLLAQVSLTIYGFLNRGSVELSYFTFDSLALIFLLLLSVVASATLFHSIYYLRDSRHRHQSWFFFSFISLNMALTGVYLTNNLIVSWIFIELTTLAAAGLINHNRNMNSLEATWKYIFICSVGIALAYIGILFASAVTNPGLSNDMSFGALKESFSNTDPVYLKMAFILILTGYSSKLEVFPLYTIGIDANYAAPAPVSAFLSSALVNGGFVAFFRVFDAMSSTGINAWMNNVLLLTGLLSLIVAAIYMQKAVNLKRIFAYSTVEHMGIILIALSLGKIGIFIALLHLTIHSLVKSGLFYQTGILHRILLSYKLSKAGGYFSLNPAGASLLIAGVVLITAFPPSGLFISEFLMLNELGKISPFLFMLTGLLFTLIIYGILTKNFQVLFGNQPTAHPLRVSVPPREYISQFILFGLAIVLCFYLPPFLSELYFSVSGADANLVYSLFNF